MVTEPERLLAIEFEWKIDPSRIEICRRPSGRAWLLGDGAYGSVSSCSCMGKEAASVMRAQHLVIAQGHEPRVGLPHR